MQRPTCRNGGQAFRMCISEGHTFAGKSVEIGGLNPPVAVSTEIVAAQSIRDNDNDIPGGCLSIATLLRGTIVDDDWLTHCTFLKFATYIIPGFAKAGRRKFESWKQTSTENNLK